MKKYIILAAMLVFLVGCSKPTVSPEQQIEEPALVQEPIAKELTMEEQQEILKKYYGLLTSKKDLEEVTDYIDKYIALLEPDIVDNIIVSLEEYIRNSTPSMELISNTLMKYYDYASEEICSFLEILDKEGNMIFTDGESINIDLNELISRAIIAENHLSKYSKGKTYQRVHDFYEGYILAAIVGSGNQYIYAQEGSSSIRQEVLDAYMGAIETHKDSITANIFSMYLEKLSLDNNDMNGVNVLEFYDNLPSIIS